MAEPTLHKFTYKELVTLMVRERGITKGLWGVYMRFGIGGANLGPNPDSVVPAAIVPVMEVGIQEFAEPSALTVDASTIPAKSGPGSPGST